MSDELDRLKADNLALRGLVHHVLTVWNKVQAGEWEDIGDEDFKRWLDEARTTLASPSPGAELLERLERAEAEVERLRSQSGASRRLDDSVAGIAGADWAKPYSQPEEPTWLTCHSSEMPSILAQAQMVEVRDRTGSVGRYRADKVDWRGLWGHPGCRCRLLLDEDGLPYVSSEGLEPYAQYVATDADGEVWQYVQKPKRPSPYFWSSAGREMHAPETHRLPGDWKKSLMRIWRDGGV